MKIKYVKEGTVASDLTRKLLEDIIRCINRYTSLMEVGSGNNETISGILCTLTRIIAIVEKDGEVPQEIADALLGMMRKNVRE